ncbi:MAG: amidophosphoribosyltransferase [Clostridiaceae bacterium]|nr:amidophosphoribosyltransferase [Clostridiaceae bacterium]
MGGLFGVVSKNSCVMDLYFGTDYHSHLGTSRGGMAVWTGNGFARSIHNIENIQFRSRFEVDLKDMKGNMGIGCISDNEPQPLTVFSHLGYYAITTVGRINNIDQLVEKSFKKNLIHFLEMSRGELNPTEVVAALIDQESTFKDGIRHAQESIEGSCTMLVLSKEGIYAARDLHGRTPLIIGEKEGAYCATFESCAFANLGYRMKYELGPGEIVLLTPDGIKQVSPPNRDKMKICAFLWVYYGYPSSEYEGVNVEIMRNRNGAVMARKDNVEVDLVAAIPDSGVAHAIGYANEAKIPYGRPFIKYTPTWSRSFTPQSQKVRNLVARMKLMPINELIKGKRLLFCDDSIVRGTQMRETVELLYKADAKEAHIRSACPPLVYGCKYLSFSRSRSELDLATRQAIKKLEGNESTALDEYSDPTTERYHCMVEYIGKKLNFTSLKYQNINDMLDAIGLPHDKICTYCWNGKE